MLIPALFVYMVCIYMFNYLKNLKLIPHLDTKFVELLTPFLNIDYVTFSVLILFLLLNIASVNRFYKVHILAVQKVKLLIHELITF